MGKNGENILTDVSLKKANKWAKSQWKHSQHHYLLGKGKSKLQWNHLTLVRMAIFKESINNKCWSECREKETLLHCLWECKLVQSLWRTIWWFLRKLNTERPHDPAIPLLGIYPEKTIIRKDRGNPVFIAAHLQ